MEIKQLKFRYVKNFTNLFKITLLFIFLAVFVSLKSQSVSSMVIDNPFSKIQKFNHSDHSVTLPDNFNIKFDIMRLKNLQPEQENRDNTYYFPDTVVVYSVSDNPIRYTYYYSEEGNRQMTILKKLTNEVWVNDSFEIRTYDSVGNPLVVEMKLWQNNSWVNSNKVINTYTTNHNVLTSISANWDGTVWVNFEKSTFTYNESGKAVAFLKENWIENSWANDLYDLYTYDDFGNLISGIRQIWESDTWTNDQQYSYTYDANNNMLTGIIQSWEVDTWVNSYGETYSYNASNLPVEYIVQLWVDNIWLNYSKYAYTYNDYNFVVSAIGQLWIDNLWVNNERAQFTQNFYGGVQSALVEHWQIDSWMNYSLSTYSHDDYGNTLSAVLYFWDGETWAINQDSLIEISYYYNLYSEYFTGYLAEASYISIITDITKISDNSLLSFSSFPNPSSSQMTLRINGIEDTKAEIYVYNLTGNKVLDLYSGSLTKGDNNISVNVSSLPAGVYIVKLSTGTIHKFLKIIILNN